VWRTPDLQQVYALPPVVHNTSSRLDMAFCL
jgi:hypothetical protein